MEAVIKLYQMKWGVNLQLPRNLYGWDAWMWGSDDVHLEKWSVSSRSGGSNPLPDTPQQFENWKNGIFRVMYHLKNVSSCSGSVGYIS